MKKLFVFVLVYFCSLVVLKADCEYKELREINNLASYIRSNYEYNESTGKFDITITNLTDKFYLIYENNDYQPSNGTVIISGLDEGSRISLGVVASLNTECYGETPRMVYVNIPYLNQYYRSNLCSGHEELNVCSSRFLDYKLSESTFLKLIEEHEEDPGNKKDEDIPKEEKPNFIDKTIEVVKDYSVPAIIVVVVSGITISIYSVIIRKIKHGL